MLNVSSAFWLKLQADGLLITEIVDFEMPGGHVRHWTTSNVPVQYTLSGALTTYLPFPGSVPRGLDETSNLAVSVIDFVIANSGDDLHALLTSDDFSQSILKIGRVFTDTPDLGRMEIAILQVGDYAYDRMQITGQARNKWKSLSVQWPYYVYQDTCQWKFGGTGCGFDTSSLTSAFSVNVASSNVLALFVQGVTQVDGYFDFGRLTVTYGTNSGHVRTIRSQVGSVFNLSHALPNTDLTGILVSVYPGCRKRLTEDCSSKFNNTENFLGFPWIPVPLNAY